MENITKDPAYNAVDPADFPAMLDVNRYGQRSTAFECNADFRPGL